MEYFLRSQDDFFGNFSAQNLQKQNGILTPSLDLQSWSPAAPAVLHCGRVCYFHTHDIEHKSFCRTEM